MILWVNGNFYFSTNYNKKSPEGILVNSIGICLVVFCGLVVYLTANSVFKRRATEDEILLTDTVLEWKAYPTVRKPGAGVFGAKIHANRGNTNNFHYVKYLVDQYFFCSLGGTVFFVIILFELNVINCIFVSFLCSFT